MKKNLLMSLVLVSILCFFGSSVKAQTGKKITINNILLSDFRSLPAVQKGAGGSLILELNENYMITYVPQYSDQFLITISSTQFEETRRTAEARLISILGITERDVCWLNVIVSTPAKINPQFGSKNYRPSMCEQENAARADINGDGTVNTIDYALVIRQYGTKSTKEDINKDSAVNALDLSIIIENLGKNVN